MYSNNIDSIVFVQSRRIELYLYTVTSKGELHLLTSGQGQKMIFQGHVAYRLMCLVKENILRPIPCLYLTPIKKL